MSSEPLQNKIRRNLKEFTEEPTFIEAANRLAEMAGFDVETEDLTEFHWDIVVTLAIHSIRRS